MANELTDEQKTLLWSRSPYGKGDRMVVREGYIGAGNFCVIEDIGLFDRNDSFPFEYRVRYDDQLTDWVKGHAIQPLKVEVKLDFSDLDVPADERCVMIVPCPRKEDR